MTDYVMLWDCLHCLTKGHMGYVYDCPNCGHPRPLKVKFYMPDPMIEATEEQMAIMGEDPNWYCKFCESGNKDSNPKCWNCNADRNADSPVHTTAEYTADNLPRSEAEVEYHDEPKPVTTDLYPPQTHVKYPLFETTCLKVSGFVFDSAVS